jgi:hypothetical protein
LFTIIQLIIAEAQLTGLLNVFRTVFIDSFDDCRSGHIQEIEMVIDMWDVKKDVIHVKYDTQTLHAQ